MLSQPEELSTALVTARGEDSWKMVPGFSSLCPWWLPAWSQAIELGLGHLRDLSTDTLVHPKLGLGDVPPQHLSLSTTQDHTLLLHPGWRECRWWEQGL